MSEDLIRVRFDHQQTGNLSVTVEVEPVDGEPAELTIQRARQELEAQGWPAELCAQCGGYGSEHQSKGGDGKFELSLDEFFGTETEAEILKDGEE